MGQKRKIKYVGPHKRIRLEGKGYVNESVRHGETISVPQHIYDSCMRTSRVQTARYESAWWLDCEPAPRPKTAPISKTDTTEA